MEEVDLSLHRVDVKPGRRYILVDESVVVLSGLEVGRDKITLPCPTLVYRNVTVELGDCFAL
jgi:hypothetical protein